MSPRDVTRPLRRALMALWGALLLALVASPGVALAASSVAVSLSGDPTEDVGMTVTVSGTADDGLFGFVYVHAGSGSCGLTAGLERERDDVETLASSLDVSGSSFEEHLNYTPPDDRTYRVCAYVGPEDVESLPAARSNAGFEARSPVASVSIEVPAGAVEGVATTITLTGTTEIQRRLFAYVMPATRSCALGPDSQAGVSGSEALADESGLRLPAGSFSRTSRLTPAVPGSLRVCAYVGESGGDIPEATDAADFSVARAPTPTPTPTPRPSTPTPVLTPQSTPVPLPSSSPTPQPTPLAQPAPTQVAQSAPIATVVAKTYGATLTTSDADQFDRLELKWRVDGDPISETIRIWDEDPSNEVNPILDGPVDDADDFDLAYGEGDERDLSVLRHLGYRQFWWQIETRAPSGAKVLSQIGMVTVVPSPMDRKAVKVSTKLTLRHSSARPGTVRLRIASSPRARVQVKVRYRGRVVATRHYTEGVGALRGIEFPLSCSSPGQYSYEARVRDPYGAQVTRRGHWTSSVGRCAALKAEERAKVLAAQRRAAEKRRKQAEAREREREASQSAPSSDSGGSSGSGCDPNYTGECLTPGIGDYDCAGGSGDGPNYVQGTVNVVGSDPYRLDADHDGLGCE